MKAVYIQKHGPIADLKISDVPMPAVGAGDVLVKVAASGVNPSDIASFEGRFPHGVLPRIVGRDFSGVVVKGPAELVGVEVWGSGGDLGITRDGTHAEHVALPKAAVIPRPKNLSLEQAAAVGVPFIAAFFALVRLGQVKAGDWVIISGAAGAVGQAAIQIACARNAHVVALVKDRTDRQALESFAVEAIAQSDQADLETIVREATHGKGADLALNGVGASIFASLVAALRVGGRQVIYSAVGGREFTLDILSFYRNQLSLLGLDTQKLNATECAAILSELVPLFETGSLKPPAIAERYPLAEAAAAYGRVAAAKSGKVSPGHDSGLAPRLVPVSSKHGSTKGPAAAIPLWAQKTPLHTGPAGRSRLECASNPKLRRSVCCPVNKQVLLLVSSRVFCCSTRWPWHSSMPQSRLRMKRASNPFWAG